MAGFVTEKLKTQLCVVGGGLAGLCAAVAAARHGTKVVLVQERPMLGGNASSEIRMWVSGAHGRNNRETGILEELRLENQWRNPDKNYNIWDTVMLEAVWKEENITLLLNTTCMDGEMEGDALRRIRCWQMTTQKFIEIEADYFADCSGDSVLAPITGAEYRVGRESREEFGETIEPPAADRLTMGNSILLQCHACDTPQSFTAPQWARKLEKRDFGPGRVPDLTQYGENFWYVELGGMGDTIADAENVRDELLALIYGVWDYLKNDPEQREKNACYALDWVGILPGKRESRRYVGEYILRQQDVEAAGRHFEDTVAFGGWSMDDHDPAGFAGTKAPTIFHPAPSPFCIPYRCLYSVNVKNLFFAGRNISTTHAALSGTRVMATCAVLGQAAGTAAALAARYGITPHEVCEKHLSQLQKLLQYDDAWIPFRERPIGELTKKAVLSGDFDDLEALRDGYDRPAEDDMTHAGAVGTQVTFSLTEPAYVESLRLVFDSDLNFDTLSEFERVMQRFMPHNRQKDMEPSQVPKTLVRSFSVEIETETGKRSIVVPENHQRLVYVPIGERVLAVTLRLDAPARVFSADLMEE